MNTRRQIAATPRISAPSVEIDDGLNAPMNKDRIQERVAMARAYLIRNPINLRPDHGLAEIIG